MGSRELVQRRGFPFSEHLADAGTALRMALLSVIILRIVLSLWMWAVREIYPQPLPPDPVSRPYVGVAEEPNQWLAVWQRWDTLHYQAIAERGYNAFDTALFVPPLYPWMMRAAGALLGGRTLLGGLMVSNVLYVFALAAFFDLARRESEDEAAAKRSTIYLAVFPTAFFFLAAYTESLYLCAAVLALAYARRETWWQAGLWGAAAALARLPGFLILLPLAYAVWEKRGEGQGLKAWPAVVLPVLGTILFPLYVWMGLKQPPWTPLLVQSARFHGGLVWPGANILEAVKQVLSGASSLTNSLELLFTLLFLLGALPVWRKLPRIYGVYYLALLALYLTRMGGEYPLLGMTRYVLALFPIFFLLGQWGRNPWINRLVLYPSWVGLLFLSGQFAIWGWAG